MKIVVIILIFMSVIKPSVEGVSPERSSMKLIREKYVKSVESEKEAKNLLSILNSQSPYDPLLEAYRGAVLGLMAKHAFNPFTKLDYLNKSKSVLAKAIAKDPNEPEMHFLRFCMEHYIPPMLGYSNNLSADRISIVENN